MNQAGPAARTRSAASTMLMPPPAATPWTTAITGASMRARRDTATWNSVAISLMYAGSVSAFSRKTRRSAPLENAGPAAVSSTTRTPRSSAQRIATSRISWQN